MFRVEVEFHCGPFSPHAGQSRKLKYSFLSEELALQFMCNVNSIPRAKSGPWIEVNYLGR